jgi:hypothetical protein
MSWRGRAFLRLASFTARRDKLGQTGRIAARLNSAFRYAIQRRLLLRGAAMGRRRAGILFATVNINKRLVLLRKAAININKTSIFYGRLSKSALRSQSLNLSQKRSQYASGGN